MHTAKQRNSSWRKWGKYFIWQKFHKLRYSLQFYLIIWICFDVFMKNIVDLSELLSFSTWRTSVETTLEDIGEGDRIPGPLPAVPDDSDFSMGEVSADFSNAVRARVSTPPPLLPGWAPGWKRGGVARWHEDNQRSVPEQRCGEVAPHRRIHAAVQAADWGEGRPRCRSPWRSISWAARPSSTPGCMHGKPTYSTQALLGPSRLPYHCAHSEIQRWAGSFILQAGNFCRNILFGGKIFFRPG